MESLLDSIIPAKILNQAMRIFALAFGVLIGTAASAEPWLVVDDLQGTIPKAPRVQNDSRNEELCRYDARAPADAADEALTAAGWLLWDEPERVGEVVIRRVVPGLAGPCRPAGRSAFVFVKGLPQSAYFPSAATANLDFALESMNLRIGQTFGKPGEAMCCWTRRREVVISLPK